MRAVQWAKARDQWIKKRQRVDVVDHGAYGETEARGNYRPWEPVPNILSAGGEGDAPGPVPLSESAGDPSR